MLAVVVSSVRASEMMLAVSEASGVFIVRARAFLLGQFLAIWPCLSHSKQRLSFLYFSLSASVMAFWAVVLVSIVLRPLVLLLSSSLLPKEGIAGQISCLSWWWSGSGGSIFGSLEALN